MITPETYKQVCANLKKIVSDQATITGQDGVGSKACTEALKAAEHQLSDDTLRVLVMGRFSSGKSTMLNALLGQSFLPMKPIPTTAVISEIIYGDRAEATLYPVKGNQLIKINNVTTQELSKYVVIDHSNSTDEPREKLYKKIVIKYPLNICRHGIMLVDSPGLDDPTCHDAITQEYLPNTDAIIYCLNSNQAFTAGDKKEIEALTSMGYKSIIFVLTYFDYIQANDEIMGTNQAAEVKAHYTKLLAPYTDLGVSGIFFVSSLYALKGKLTNDHQLLEKSNFISLEKRLEEILYNEKGRMKLLRALYDAKRANREAGQQLNDFIELANTDSQTLREKVDMAQNNLNQARTKASNILSQFNLGTQAIVETIKDRTRAYFLNDILSNINTWVNEFQPAEGQEFNIWSPRKSATIFTESCITYVQKQIETQMAQWCENQVTSYIQPELERLTNQQNANLEAYENDLQNIRATLNLSVDGSEISGNAGASKTNRILSAIAGLFLNPASLVAGGVAGWQGLVSSLVTTIIGFLVVGVIGLFTPIGLPAVIITFIASAILSVSVVGGNVETKIKEKIASKLSEELTKHQETMVANTGNAVSEVIDKIQQAIANELNAPVRQYEKIVDEAKRNAQSGNAALQQRINKYKQLRQENTTLADSMDRFMQTIVA